MKFTITLLLFHAVFMLKAQTLSDPNLQSMIEAERAFSEMARETNTRDAFLAFLSEHAVTFEREPRIGKKHFETQLPHASLLSWKPAYCDLAASGDFGFDTGPWELRTNREDARPSAFGQFVTVWTKQADGKWKVALDIGISHPDPSDSAELKTSTIQTKKTKKRKGDFHIVTEVEEKFILNCSAEGNKAYSQVLSEEARILRTGKSPIILPSEIEAFLKDESSSVDYLVLGGSIAHSKDMAFVYGTATVKTSREGHIQSEKANYVRIWKKEDGNRWRIVVDVLSQG